MKTFIKEITLKEINPGQEVHMGYHTVFLGGCGCGSVLKLLEYLSCLVVHLLGLAYGWVMHLTYSHFDA